MEKVKKTLILGLLLATLALPTGGKMARAQVVTATDTSVQIEDLKSTLITLLTQLIAQLQAQISTILAQQNHQQTQIDTIVQNVAPVIPATPNTGGTSTGNTTTSPVVPTPTPVDSSVHPKVYNATCSGIECVVSILTVNGDIFIATNDAVTPSSFTITKDGVPVTDTSGITVRVRGANTGVIVYPNGFRIQQSDSGAIFAEITIGNTPSGQYSATLNSFSWHTYNGSNQDGTAKLGDLQTTNLTDQPVAAFKVTQ